MFKAILSLGFVWILFIVSAIAAYITHIVWAIDILTGAATDSQIVIALIGLFPPVGVIHGYMIWF